MVAHDDLLVHPAAAGVADVGLQARPTREHPALDDTRLDERPRRMTDRGDGLSGLEERADELDRVRVGAELVGVGHAAREHEPDEVVRVRVGDRDGGLEDVLLVEMVERLHVARFRGDEHGCALGLLHRLPRVGELDLLDAFVGDEEGDLVSGQCCHGSSSVVFGLVPPDRCSGTPHSPNRCVPVDATASSSNRE